MRRLTRWHNVDVAREQDRFPITAPLSSTAENWASGEVPALLCARFAGILFQQRIRIGFPQIRVEIALS